LWFEDIKETTLNRGNVFSDKSLGVTIIPIQRLGNSINFYVQMENPVCVPRKPKITLFFPQEIVSAGESLRSPVSFLNNDSYTCGESKFKLEVKAPQSWKYTIYFSPEADSEGNVVLAPQKNAWAEVKFDKIPENTLPGEYSVKYELTNLKSGMKTEKEFSVIVLPAKLSISRIEPISGPIGTKIRIFGSGFSTTENNLIIFRNISNPNIYLEFYTKSIDGITLDFTVKCNTNNCQLPLGTYEIIVQKGKETSNAVKFELTAPSPITFSSPKNTPLKSQALASILQALQQTLLLLQEKLNLY
jgi:hypothetical protein